MHSARRRRTSVCRLPQSGFLFFLLLCLLACRGPARPHTALSAHADPLRADFNRDIGHVRIVTLVAPT
jgi:hypothetical protein